MNPPTDGGGLPGLGIRRPWLVIVLNLLLVVAGLAALRGVEVRELPNIDRPVVSVRAEYPGAAPQTLDAEVTRVLEAAAARVPGVDSVRSASEEGTLRVHVTFRPGVDLITAANDVREAVSRASRELPAGVRNLSVIKADANAEPVMQLAVASATLPIDALTRAIQDRIEPALVAVPGVADVTLFGERERVLRVRLSPAGLTARGLAVDDVVAALGSARADVPAGSLDSAQQELLVRANASLATPAQVRALRLPGGVPLGELADVYFDPADAQAWVRLDGRTVISLGVVRQAQANTLAISEGVRAVLARLALDDPDLRFTVVADDAVFVEGAIDEVLLSMALSVLIVVAVVGLFIGQWRATLIPAVAIPVSLIGTLAALWAMGFSLNLITLLALLLATGLVVDDAIVVLENIQRRRRGGLPPRAAAVIGAREVFFAVLATTATLISVFIPISFLPSAAGRLFTEFGFVMAFAVLISSFVALSLAPMMASRIDIVAAPGRFAAALGRLGARAAAGYNRALQALLGRRAVVLARGRGRCGGRRPRAAPDRQRARTDRRPRRAARAAHRPRRYRPGLRRPPARAGAARAAAGARRGPAAQRLHRHRPVGPEPRADRRAAGRLVAAHGQPGRAGGPAAAGAGRHPRRAGAHFWRQQPGGAQRGRRAAGGGDRQRP